MDDRNYLEGRRTWEARAEVPHLDEIQDLRRQVITARTAKIDEVKHLRARYAHNGTWDALRKAHRCGIQNEIALEIARGSETAPPRKATEAELERLAAADPRVLALLDQVEEDIARMILLDNEIEVLSADILAFGEEINRDQGILRFASADRAQG